MLKRIQTAKQRRPEQEYEEPNNPKAVDHTELDATTQAALDEIDQVLEECDMPPKDELVYAGSLALSHWGS